MLVELAGVAKSAGLRLVVIGLSDAHSADGVDNRVVPSYVSSVPRCMKCTPPDTISAPHSVWRRYSGRTRRHRSHTSSMRTWSAVRPRGWRTFRRCPPCMSSTFTTRMHHARVKFGLFARQRLSSNVIALSSAQRKWYDELGGDDASIVVCPNGIGEPAVAADRAAVRAGIGVPEGHLLAVCVSLMRPEKGHADLVEAVRLLPADVPLVVAMAGDGPLLDGIRTTVESDPVLRERIRVLGFRRRRR